MSDYQHKPNRGSLFKNDKREKDSHPHAKGSALIGGVEYWVSAWTETSEGGTRYQSLSFQPKEENKPEAVPSDDFVDDDIPF